MYTMSLPIRISIQEERPVCPILSPPKTRFILTVFEVLQRVAGNDATSEFNKAGHRKATRALDNFYVNNMCVGRVESTMALFFGRIFGVAKKPTDVGSEDQETATETAAVTATPQEEALLKDAHAGVETEEDNSTEWSVRLV